MPAIPNVGMLPTGQDLAWVALGLLLAAAVRKLWLARGKGPTEQASDRLGRSAGSQSQYWGKVLLQRLYAMAALAILILGVSTLRVPLTLVETLNSHPATNLSLRWGELTIAAPSCSARTPSARTLSSDGLASAHSLCQPPNWLTRNLSPYQTDVQQAPTVYENSVGFWGLRATQRQVQERGGGRFAIDDNAQLWYSASDGTNPQDNAHRYQLQAPAQLANWLQLGCWVFCLPLLFSFLRRLLAAMDRGLALDQHPGLPVQTLLLVVLSLLCLSPLWQIWADAASRFAIAGFLPWSDASGWFHGFNYLLSFDELESWTVRRPLNPAFLAGLYYLTDLNWANTLVLRALILAVSFGFLCRVLISQFGLVATLAAAAVATVFAQDFIPVALTESQGLIFATTGFAWLVLGATQQRLIYYLMGVSLISLALMLRLGPVGLLGAFVIWPLVGVGRTERWRWVRWSIAAILVGLLPTWLWTTLYYTGNNMPGANFALTFYGLAFGGAPWTLFAEHYPQLANQADAEVARIVWQQALHQVRTEPLMLLQGFARFTYNYFHYLFVYFDQPLRRLFCLLFALGLISACFGALRRASNPLASLLLLSWLGVLATTPLIYWSLDAYRAFAVSVPLDMLLIAAGVQLLLRLPQLAWQPLPSTSTKPAFGLGLFTSLLIVSLSLLPWWAMRQEQPPASDLLVTVAAAEFTQDLELSEPETASQESCAPKQRKTLLDLGGSSPLIQLSSNPSTKTWLNQINYQEFRYDPSFYHSPIASQLLALEPGDRLIHGFDYATEESAKKSLASNRLYVVLPYNLALTSQGPIHGLHQLCVEPFDESLPSQRYQLYRATSLIKAL